MKKAGRKAGLLIFIGMLAHGVRWPPKLGSLSVMHLFWNVFRPKK
jgi:hypothetical protein